MGNLFRRFINDQSGVTAIEYGDYIVDKHAAGSFPAG